MKKIVLPELGEGIEKATVACWNVKPGDQVNKDDEVVELVTDKACFNLEAGTTGTVVKIIVAQGEDARVGDTLAVIGDSR
jgi:pyruvate/2-oxoglutarate dehydrogenase complex dihydrolipoamide acyltransferase (E2) component